MTIIVSTVSQHGITVVGDRAVSRRSGDDDLTVLDSGADKVFYSDAANIAFACWGNTDFGGTPYSDWIRGIVLSAIEPGMSLLAASEMLADQINQRLAPIAESRRGWSSLRRGVHVSGYVDSLPCIYHVHTGAPEEGHHPLRVYRDFPDVHGGGADTHQQNLARGKRAQVFNGFHELFGLVGDAFGDLRDRLETEFDVRIPAPTLRGQLELDRALIRFAAGLLRAGDRAPQVSLDVTDVAFNASGRIVVGELASGLPPLSGAVSSPTASVWRNDHTDV